MHGLNYHHLVYFWLVAREGSIARAAELLHLAHPTISKQLHQLEASFVDGRCALMRSIRAGQGLVRSAIGYTDHDASPVNR